MVTKKIKKCIIIFMKYEIVLFDLDGTILNTLDDLSDSLNFILGEFGMPLHTVEEVKYFVGNGIPKLIERAIPEGTSNPHYEKVLEKYISYYREHSLIKTREYEGMSDLLKKLKAGGVKLAVVTNKEEKAAKLLCQKFFPDLFDYVWGGKTGVPHKPDSVGVNFVLGSIGNVNPSKAVFIGDSDVDIQTGKNAGLDVIGVSWGFRGRKFLFEHGADKVADTMAELFELLK